MTDDSKSNALGDFGRLAAMIASLAQTIDARADAPPDTSYTAKLLSKGTKKVAQKVGEEGTELAIALVAEDDESVANEAADVLYHLLVALRARGVSLDEVAAILEGRDGTSGLVEKASRAKS